MKPSPNPYMPPASEKEEEGTSPAHAESPRPPAWIEHGHLGVRADASLPAVCFKCGKTGEMRWRRQVFASTAAAPSQPLGTRILLGALAGAMFGAVGGALAASAAGAPRPGTAIVLPLCPRCEVRWTNRSLLLIGALLATLTAMLYALSTVGDNIRAHTPWVPLIEVFAAPAGLFAFRRFVVAKAQLGAARVEMDYVILTGVPPAAQEAVVARVEKKKRKKQNAESPSIS